MGDCLDFSQTDRSATNRLDAIGTELRERGIGRGKGDGDGGGE